MFFNDLLIQLLIERLLSGSQPYIASHPELGVPIGIFNLKDEPNRESRVKSILKMGVKGNPLSHFLSQKLGVKVIIPSYFALTNEELEEKIKDLEEEIVRLERGNRTSRRNRDYEVLGGLGDIVYELEKDRNIQQKSFSELGGMLETIKNISTGKFELKDSLGSYLDYLSMTDKIRENLTKNIGVTRSLMLEIQNTIASASMNLDGFSLTSTDVLKTLEDTMGEVGRQITISPEVLSDLTKIDSLFGELSADFVSGFDKIGRGSAEAFKAYEGAVLASQNLGLVTSKLLPEVTKNITKINTYGFQSGVQGLTKMTAQAQLLGYNFQSALNAADRVFSPEGAIEAAAQLQMIGGAASELLDPFQLMYMAQNDVESLQNAIIETAKSAVQFNEETGEFGISPSERMRLKSTAEALGQDYDNIAEAAIKAKKRAEALSRIKIGGDIDENTAEFLASIADVKDGEFVINFGEQQIKLEDVSTELLPEQIEKLREQANMSALDLDEVNRQQLTVQKATEAHAANIFNLLLSDQIAKSKGTDALSVFFDPTEVASRVQTEGQGVVTDVMGGENLGGIFDSVNQAVTNALQNVVSVESPNDFIIQPNNQMESFSENTLNLINPNPMDTIIGGTNLFDTTTIENNTNNTTTNNQGTPNININGTLTLKMDGSSMKISASDFFRAFNPQDYQKLALQINDVVYGSQG